MHNIIHAFEGCALVSLIYIIVKDLQQMLCTSMSVKYQTPNPMHCLEVEAIPANDDKHWFHSTHILASSSHSIIPGTKTIPVSKPIPCRP